MFKSYDYSKNELLLFYLSSLLAAIAVISVLPLDRFFWPNFAYIGLAPALIYGGLLFTRPAIAGGVALGLAIVILAFAYWTRHDGMGWLIYLFSLPASFIASIALAFKARQLSYWKAFLVSLFAIPTSTYIYYFLFSAL